MLQDELGCRIICCKITRQDNIILGITDYDQDVTIDSIVYHSNAGFNISGIESNTSISPDNAVAEGFIHSEFIKAEDLISGRYDFGYVEIFESYILNGELENTSLLKSGYLCSITINNFKISAEIRGISILTEKIVGSSYSKTCRARLGDLKCKVDLTSLTKVGSVTSVISNREFQDSSREEESGYYNYGMLSFSSGKNKDLFMEVKFSSDHNIVLMMSMPFDIEVGDTYTIIAGCDKRFSTCINKFDNACNFRGEPHVPSTIEVNKA